MAICNLKMAEFDTVVQEKSLVLVDFWATWCGPCRMVAPVMEALAEKYDGRVLVAKVNVDEEPALAQRFGVMSIPTVVVLKNGQEVDRKVGAMPGTAYESVLDANL